MPDVTPHQQIVPLDHSRLTRWREGAARLGEAATALRGELDEVARDPTRHRLTRAAKAARWAEAQCAGTEQAIANAIACEIENDALAAY